MSFRDTDYILDRRALRRKLTWWRVAAIVALIVAVAVAGWRVTNAMRPAGFQAHIARLSIEGLITGDRGTLTLLDDIAKSNASAVILSIDSPGGTTTGAERLYDHIRSLAEKKPVVAVVGTLAASGAYVAALGADHIVAQGNSLVGSIGVLVQYPNVSTLLDKVGVKLEEIKSSPLKAAPNGMEPTSPEARAALAAVVMDSYAWFKDLVQTRRAMDDAQVALVADGRVFTGRQGVGLKLIDQVGSEKDAIAWLENEKHIAHDLPIRDWRKDRSLERLGFLGVSADVAELIGFSGFAHTLQRLDEARESRALDGVMAVWQGAASD